MNRSRIPSMIGASPSVALGNLIPNIAVSSIDYESTLEGVGVSPLIDVLETLVISIHH
jgi:hypothetical protein